MDYWAVVLAVVAVLLAIYYYICKDLDYFKKNGIIHIPPLPVLGNFAPMVFRRTSLADWIENIYNLHPDAKYVGAYDFMRPVLVIRDPEIMKSICIKNFDNFMNHRAFIDEALDPMFGSNLFSLRGDKWKEIRTILSPAFTSSKMKSMFKLMTDYAAQFGDFMASLPKEKRETELKNAFTRYTNDVIATCAFGISVDSMRDPNNDFYVYGKKATTFTSWRSMKLFIQRSFPTIAKLLNVKFVDKDVAKFFIDVVQTTISTRDKDNIYRPDMMQLMMETRGKKNTSRELTIEEIVAQAFIFFFGGFDTSSALMSFAAYEIAVNPDIQKKLQDEIEKAFQSNNGELTYEAVSGMEYLDAILNETLRLHTLAVFLDRVCEKRLELPPALPGGKPFIVEEGMNIWFPLYGMNHDPKYFDEPYKFMPERFFDEERKSRASGVYHPFGIGPRICIGNRFALLETKVLFCHLLARCNFKPSPKTPIPMRYAKGVFGVTAQDGFWLQLEPRENPAVKSGAHNGVAKA